MSLLSSGRTGVRRLRQLLALLAVATMLPLLSAAPAAAAPPANDARTAPQVIGSLPVTIQATTVESTVEPDEPFGCASLKGSIWYSFTPAKSRSILIALAAAGDMDASLDVFTRVRSQLTGAACSVTDRRGEAVVDLDVTAGTEYLIRVGPLFNSVADAFTLRVLVPDDPATAPGEALPAGGTSASVDRFANQDDAWYVDLVRGRTYRMNFVSVGEPCATVEVFPAGTKSFAAAPLFNRHCDAHRVFVAEKSGRYPIRVSAPRFSRDVLKYRLRVGLALADDTAPGIRLPADTDIRGRLTGSELDALDLYRFGVAHRSDMRVRLHTKSQFQLSLRKAGGRLLASGSRVLSVRLPKGRYYVAVQAIDGADGTYVLRRHARTITTASTLVNGRHKTAVGPGRAVTLAVRVRPAVDGRATLTVERHDPIDGWLFTARFHPAVVDGRASVSWTPPDLGRYRVTGSFDGTFRASPAEGGVATFVVVEPLTLARLGQ